MERRGGIIYEQTEVTAFEGGERPEACHARRTIVLGGEAYLTRLPKRHRILIPVYSLIVLTEPLRDAQWSQIGWRNGESIASNRFTVDYLTKTADGRIRFGSRGAPYSLASKITVSVRRTRLPYGPTGAA